MAIVTWNELLQGEELAYRTEIPARRADVVPIPDGLHPRVLDSLAGLGLDGLYRHQAEAFHATERGEHIVVSTGTASGKTLAFNLPVLNALAEEPKLRALYLYPTKALAQDQARALAAFKLPRLRPAIYDGDTETERRWQIRKWANVILTNPDMLHVGVLPHHDRWGDVLQNLRYVVVDEAHVYRGVFGSHVANVLRRLRRAASIYGAEPQFLLASATIANPGELVESLLGVEATVIGKDARSARSENVASGTRPSSTRSCSSARARSERAPGCSATSWSAACGQSASRSRARRPSSSTASHPSVSAPSWRRASPLTAPATRRRSGATSSGAWSKASCSVSRPPTRSSSESTSGSWTVQSRSASPGQWPACASSGAGREGEARASPSSSQARTLSTSSSCGSPRRS